MNSPAVEWLNEGLMSVLSPSRAFVLNIHIIALNIHIIALNIHIIALVGRSFAFAGVPSEFKKGLKRTR